MENISILNLEEFKQLSNDILNKINEKQIQTSKKQTLGEKKSKKKKEVIKKMNELSDEDESNDDEIIFHDANNNYMIEEIANLDRMMIIEQPNNRLQQLLNYAHPLIVVDARLLEESFVQLKEIIGSNNDELQTSDEELVKLLIRNDFDLNRVIPIVLRCE